MSREVLVSSRRLKRKKRFLRFFLILFLFFLICVGVISIFLYSDKFKIKDIKISGLVNTSEEEVRKELVSILSAKTFLIIPQNTFFSFPKESARVVLMNNFPRLSRVETKMSFPSSLSFSVEEREPASVLCRDLVGCFYVDKTGFIFEEAPIFSSGVFLKFVDTRQEKPVRGEFLLAPEIFAKVVKFEQNLRALSLPVAEIDLKDDGVCEFHMTNGWYVILDEKDDWEVAYNNLMSFLDQFFAGEEADLEYIDLRFDNKVFFKKQ